jgi:adenosylcobinamide-phosphate guanylyltransferase
MIGLVMAGGKGTRMNLDNEKLLLEYKKPVILHVVDSLKNSNSFSKILAITSCNSPKTKKLLEKNY